MLLPDTVSDTKMLIGDTTGNEIMALVADPGHMFVEEKQLPAAHFIGTINDPPAPITEPEIKSGS
ncbi:MAG: hypothetical protein U0Z75_06200 [Deinococcaceae bacterium]